MGHDRFQTTRVAGQAIPESHRQSLKRRSARVSFPWPRPPHFRKVGPLYLATLTIMVNSVASGPGGRGLLGGAADR